ncbi:adhesion G protein-coupled receptor L3-like [Amblyraja radiata]|uniref:adhesion G protein-coupled receptor L3-like n=1 Tax=Amblyraja radiata TaxID=386614 RepID=UPI001401DB9F|nr:adhesion G protein-coupled receptor L3-like [Amblyraja radiata]
MVTIALSNSSSRWEMKLQPRTMFKGNNASFIFLELAGSAKAPQILYDNGGILITLPINTDLVLVISNTTSPNISQFVEENSFSLTFNNTKGLKKEDVICAYLVIKNCTATWSSVGCVETVNETSINCNCSKFSTIIVLQKIQSILKITEIIKKIDADNTTQEELQTTLMGAASDAATFGELRFKHDTIEVVLQAANRKNLPSEPAKLSTENAAIEMKWDAFKGPHPDLVYIFIIAVSASTFTKGHALTTDTSEDKSMVGSDVVEISIGKSESVQLSSPITLRMKLNQNKTGMTDSCVFWNKTKSSWATYGCSLVKSDQNSTTCECMHLTSFSVLLSRTPIPAVHERNLEIITYVGITLSLICLFMSMVIFTYCRSISSVRITIHKQLCLTMFLAELLFLINSIKVTNEMLCMIVAILLHYLFLACFAWMLLEGVQLYLMVVKVFHSRSLRKTYLFLVGYGAPLIIVIPVASISMDAYDRKICWLNITSGYVWAFIGPICAIIGLNIIFFIITIWKLADKFSLLSTDVPHYKKVRSFTYTAVGQLVLLGGTWIFGIFHFNNNTIAMAYIFTAINSFQGLFIFVLHCLANKQIRTELRKRLCNSTASSTSAVVKQTQHTSQVTDNFKSTSATNVYS